MTTVKIGFSNCRLSPLIGSCHTPTVSFRSKSTSRRENEGVAWSHRQLKLNRLLSSKKPRKSVYRGPLICDTTSSTQEDAKSPWSVSIEQGYKFFTVNKSTRPVTQRAVARSRRVKLPYAENGHIRSYKTLSSVPRSRSKSPVIVHKADDLISKINSSRNKRLEVQQQMHDNDANKREQFTQIIKKVKETFHLQTVEEDRKLRSKHNMFDKYLNSEELLRYLKSL